MNKLNKLINYFINEAASCSEFISTREAPGVSNRAAVKLHRVKFKLKKKKKEDNK